MTVLQKFRVGKKQNKLFGIWVCYIQRYWPCCPDALWRGQVLSHPEVDATRTVSNHLVEIIDVLGIEAARLALLKEMRSVIEFDGSCAPATPRPCTSARSFQLN